MLPPLHHGNLLICEAVQLVHDPVNAGSSMPVVVGYFTRLCLKGQMFRVTSNELLVTYHSLLAPRYLSKQVQTLQPH